MHGRAASSCPARTFSDSAGHDEADSAPMMSLTLLDGSVVTLDSGCRRADDVVEVWVERLNPALGEDFGWEREPYALIQYDEKRSKKRTRASGTHLAREKARAKKLLGSESVRGASAGQADRCDLSSRRHSGKGR